jgi:FKBP-type peptidyl-prolyl cis-trans isomerase 2
MSFQKKDFIEVEFTGKVKDGGIFDSNVKSDLQKLNPQATPKPFIFSLGEGMFLQGIDDFIIGKDTGRYTLELSPEKAFGPRSSEFVQMVPIKVFREQNLNPAVGAVFNFDGRMAKVLSNSSGRVMVDFNHPLAGKSVIYEINILRKVDDINEKVKAFTEFLFRKEFKFTVEGNKIILEVEPKYAQFITMFGDKFKEVLDLELQVKSLEEKKTEETAEEKQ